MFESLPASAPTPEVRVDVRVPGPRGVGERRVGQAMLAPPAATGRPGSGLVEEFAQIVEAATLAAAVAGPGTGPEVLRAGLAGAPGPGLAGLLAGLDVAQVSDAVLLEAVDAFDRLASWVVSRQAVVVNELRRRRQVQGRARFVGDEIAARLGTTRAAGERLVGEAMGLEQVPQVWDGLDAGQVDARKAAVLCEELLALPASVRFAVTDEVMGVAGDLTVPALRARIRRRALAVDPDAAVRAHERARRDRFVSLEPVRDGMAWLHAYLPAPDAVAVHTTLTALADAAPADDPRSTDARRADALVDLATRWLDAGTSPDGTPLPRRQRRLPHLQVTIAATTLAGDDDAPADLAGYGPITAHVARRIATGATWAPVLVDPTTGQSRPVPKTRRGTKGPDGARSPEPSEPAGTTRPPGYRPTAALVEEVLTRDRTCTFPGCRVPAERCDIDHIDPFDPDQPADTQTIEENLHALCRHHHNLKTHGGWHVARDHTTGTTHWTAPTGHTYQRRPEPAVGAEHPGDRPRAGAERSGRSARDDGPGHGPPPF